MFSIGWPEFFIILVVAIIVVGPKDLPKALFTVGKYVKSARKIGRDFQRHVDDMMREAELDDAAKTLKDVRNFNPKTRITKEIEKTIDPTGSLQDSLDPTTGLRRGAAKPAKPTASRVAAADKTGDVADTVAAQTGGTPDAGADAGLSPVAEAGAAVDDKAAGDGDAKEAPAPAPAKKAAAPSTTAGDKATAADDTAKDGPSRAAKDGPSRAATGA